MNMSYNDLITHLAQGGELHFFHLDAHYSISHNKEGWYFTEFNNSEYQMFSTYDGLLESADIDGNRIEDIWDDVVIDVIF